MNEGREGGRRVEAEMVKGVGSGHTCFTSRCGRGPTLRGWWCTQMFTSSVSRSPPKEGSASSAGTPLRVKRKRKGCEGWAFYGKGIKGWSEGLGGRLDRMREGLERMREEERGTREGVGDDWRGWERMRGEWERMGREGRGMEEDGRGTRDKRGMGSERRERYDDR